MEIQEKSGNAFYVLAQFWQNTLLVEILKAMLRHVFASWNMFSQI
jgi:hypothetical protein